MIGLNGFDVEEINVELLSLPLDMPWLDSGTGKEDKIDIFVDDSSKMLELGNVSDSSCLELKELESCEDGDCCS